MCHRVTGSSGTQMKATGTDAECAALHLPQLPKAFYVDDVNSAQGVLKQIFGAELVLLSDIAHILRRFGETVDDQHSKKDRHGLVWAGWLAGCGCGCCCCCPMASPSVVYSCRSQGTHALPLLQLPSAWHALAQAYGLPVLTPNLSACHGADFLRELSAAFFVRLAGDKERLEAALRQRGMSEQEVAGKDDKYWARRCRRTIRPQQELLAALQAVMDKYAQKVHGMCLVGVRQDAADAADVRRDGQRAHPGGEGQHLR
jgi:hypothetical protein